MFFWLIFQYKLKKLLFSDGCVYNKSLCWFFGISNLCSSENKGRQMEKISRCPQTACDSEEKMDVPAEMRF